VEPEVSLLYRQEPATSPYPDTYQSSSWTPHYFSEIHFNIIFHLSLGLLSGSFLQVSPPKPYVPFSLTRAKWSANLTLSD
jgi:hypothetical protein